MPHRRYRESRRKLLYAVAAALGVIALIGAAWFLGGHHGGNPPAAGPSATPREEPVHHPTPHHRRHRHPHPGRSDQTPANGTQPALAGPPGFPLGGATQIQVTFDPRVPHHAVLTVTSSGSPIGIRWAFRTAGGVRSEQTRTTSRFWSAGATVRGAEPLTGVIAQVASGTIACTVSIDGRVVDRRSNSGSFPLVSCYG